MVTQFLFISCPKTKIFVGVFYHEKLKNEQDDKFINNLTQKPTVKLKISDSVLQNTQS